jgi:cation diffusion facilitator CzcD-associated flavoprotein CzcO
VQLGCKRLVFDSNYFASLHADNINLRFTRVESVDETGIIGADKGRDEFDVVIWATGFAGKPDFSEYRDLVLTSRSHNAVPVGQNIWQIGRRAA